MFQFQLRTLFGFTLAAAWLFGCLFALPNWLGCLMLTVATLGVLPAVASGLIFGRGAARAFTLGAATLCWVTAMLDMMAVYMLAVAIAEFGSGDLSSEQWAQGLRALDESHVPLKTAFVTHFALLGMAGGLSVAVRAWLRPNSQDAAPRDVSLADRFLPVPAPDSERSQRRRLIGWLLAGGATLAMMAGTIGLMFVGGEYAIALFWPATLMLYPALIVLVWHGQGAERAFAAGALGTALVTLLLNMGLVLMAQNASLDEPAYWFLALLGVKWALVIGGGVVGVLVRAIAQRTPDVELGQATLSVPANVTEGATVPAASTAGRETLSIVTPEGEPASDAVVESLSGDTHLRVDWGRHRADAPHELAGPLLAPEPSAASPGEAEDDEDRPIRRPR